MKIGIFGGSFDPVHYGHLLLAQQCLETAGLDRVLFVPAAQSPLKPEAPRAESKARLEMLQLAIADHPQFSISTVELDRGEISYTFDTLEALKIEFQNEQLFLMIGIDSLLDFAKWHRPADILKLASLLVVQRPGIDSTKIELAWQTLNTFLDDDTLAATRNHAVATQSFDFSSTELRQRVQEGRSVRYRTPRAVEKYIETQGLYR